MRHCLSIRDFTKDQCLQIFNTADQFIDKDGRLIGSADSASNKLLRGVTVANVFFEPSTRTRSAFELSAKRLGATVINFEPTRSSRAKGESLLDTVRCLEAMNARCFVIRHSAPGAAHFFAEHVRQAAVINAGDGYHEHPTQALLDAYTLWRQHPHFNLRRVAIVGDIAHSRVARSQIYVLSILGVTDIRIIAPLTLLPKHAESLGARVYTDLEKGLQDVDVVVALRLQKERMRAGTIPGPKAFSRRYGISTDKLAPNVTIMHPGPVNREVELTSDLADGPQSVIWQQVSAGVAVRMALFQLILGAGL